MFKQQEDKLTSYQNTINVADNYQQVWQNLPEFANGITALKSVDSAIAINAAIQRQNITGITIGKSEKKLSLVNFILNVSGAVAAYAHSIGNKELFKKMNFKISYLNQQRDSIIAGTAQDVLNTANLLIDQLKDYGITSQVLTSLQSEIDDYNKNFVSAPEQAINNRKNITKNILPALFNQADAIIKDKLLKLVVQFKDSNPDFVIQFTDSTRIGSTGSRHTKLFAAVTYTDGKYSYPAAGAEIMISTVLLVGTTDAKGKCTITKVPVNLKAGKSAYDVKITYNGITNTFPQVEFKRGKAAILKYEFSVPVNVTEPMAQKITVK